MTTIRTFRKRQEYIGISRVQAYVYQHGLCGEHRDLVVTISAEGFDDLRHVFDLPLGPGHLQ